MPGHRTPTSATAWLARAARLVPGSARPAPPAPLVHRRSKAIQPRASASLVPSHSQKRPFRPLRPLQPAQGSPAPDRRLARRSYATVSAADLLFGQPVHETHPHLLEPGELTPGISAQEYYDRRCALAAALPAGSAAVLRAADLQYRSGAVFYPYRQESDFFYLTGFAEQEALVVIRKDTDGADGADAFFALLVRPKDARAEQWSGPWSGVDAARDVFNADEAADIGAADRLLPKLLGGARTVYINAAAAAAPSSSAAAAPAPSLKPILDAAGVTSVRPLGPLLAPQRAVKSPAEIANMRRAGRLSGRALSDAMRRPWTREKDLAAFLAHGFCQDGGDGIAYVPVVAGGPRGQLIHYVLNNAALQPGETVLVDAGGEYGTYIADITRTWPVSGRFSAAQRDLYEAVLRVQRSSVSLCRAAGGLSLDQIHRITADGLRRELAKLGFDLDGPGGGDALNATLFPHHVGHYVGLDVHDTPSFPRHTPLRAGHCITIEPGVYVPDDARWPAAFRGLAVRIEDSLCVGEEDPYIFTTEAVKEVVDIEALRDGPATA